jgi:hypothetical protein
MFLRSDRTSQPVRAESFSPNCIQGSNS